MAHRGVRVGVTHLAVGVETSLPKAVEDRTQPHARQRHSRLLAVVGGGDDDEDANVRARTADHLLEHGISLEGLVAHQQDRPPGVLDAAARSVAVAVEHAWVCCVVELEVVAELARVDEAELAPWALVDIHDVPPSAPPSQGTTARPDVIEGHSSDCGDQRGPLRGTVRATTHPRLGGPVAERRIVEEDRHPDDRPGRGSGRGPVIGLLVVMAIVLVVLVVYLVNGDSDDDGDGVNPADIEVDIGDEEG